MPGKLENRKNSVFLPLPSLNIVSYPFPAFCSGSSKYENYFTHRL
jgi:hypothetical protein